MSFFWRYIEINKVLLITIIKKVHLRWGSNPQPSDQKSDAIPTQAPEAFYFFSKSKDYIDNLLLLYLLLYFYLPLNN